MACCSGSKDKDPLTMEEQPVAPTETNEETQEASNDEDNDQGLPVPSLGGVADAAEEAALAQMPWYVRAGRSCGCL